jgi:hypothetical protein
MTNDGNRVTRAIRGILFGADDPRMCSGGIKEL